MNSVAESLRKKVHAYIETRSLISIKERTIVHPNGLTARWSFDFRPLLSDADTLDALCALLWDTLKDEGDFQVGGLETAAISLVAGMILKGKQQGKKMTGFYIRKSRKKTGLQNHIEGDVTEKKIVLVDDLLNSGGSFIRQVKALESVGRKVHAVCVVVRFREPAFYSFFHERNIKIIDLFSLDDFPSTGGIAALAKRESLSGTKEFFTVEWMHKGMSTDYFNVSPRSEVILDSKCVYIQSDSAIQALRQSDGSLTWTYALKKGIQAHQTFPSPLLHGGTIFAPLPDGNLHAIDVESGQRKWLYADADWVSAPSLDEATNTLFVPLEYGLKNKAGGLAALDASTGVVRWKQMLASRVRTRPLTIGARMQVFFASEDGVVHACNSKTGAVIWTFRASASILGHFAYDESRDVVCFGSYDHFLYVLDARYGRVMHRIEAFDSVHSTPFIHDGFVYFGLLDKRIVCVSLASGNVHWSHWTNGRVFATPRIFENVLYCGSNDGKVYALHPKTGKLLGTFQITERVVNAISYNSETKRYFVPSHTGDVYCLKRVEEV